MKRYVRAACLVVPLAALAQPGWCNDRQVVDQYGIHGFNHLLGAADGQVMWTGPDVQDWLIHKTKKGYTIRLLSADRWENWYLTCDPTGKKMTVFLSPKATGGSYWNLSLQGGEGRTTILAKAGKGKGWSLGKGKAIRCKDKGGKPFVA
jgi:hypothetical protein